LRKERTTGCACSLRRRNAKEKGASDQTSFRRPGKREGAVPSNAGVKPEKPDNGSKKKTEEGIERFTGRLESKARGRAIGGWGRITKDYPSSPAILRREQTRKGSKEGRLTACRSGKKLMNGGKELNRKARCGRWSRVEGRRRSKKP